MLLYIKNLINCKVFIGTSEVGIVRDAIFSNQDWSVQFLSVRTGGWLYRRNLIVSTSKVIQVDSEKRKIFLSITQFEFKQSPTYRSLFFDFYHWPYFWTGAGLWGSPITSDIFRDGIPANEKIELTDSPSQAHPILKPLDETNPDHRKYFPFLRSVEGTIGYHADATDGEIGFIQNFLFHPKDWKILYLVIDARTLSPGLTILMSTHWLTTIDWENLVFKFVFSQETVRAAPPFTQSVYETLWDNNAYETAIWDYYKRVLRRAGGSNGRDELVYRKAV